MQKRTSSSGFTLIEIGIVLVVIGLLVGAILAGRSILAASKTQAQTIQLQKISSAMNTFRSRYNALPGDLTAVQAPNMGLNITYGGDGNGQINDSSGANPPTTTNNEPMLFFQHLTTAGLIPPTYITGADLAGTACYVPYTGLPSYYSLSLSPQMGMVAVTYNRNVALFLGISDCGMSVAKSVSPTGVMTPSQAFDIDVKIDDGIPSTGKVTAVAAPTTLDNTIDGTLDTAAGQCVTTNAATVYNATNNTLLCRLLVQIQ